MGKKEKADQLKALKEYRDGLIFTFIMANLLWVLGITLMQQSKVFTHRNTCTRTHTL